LTTWLCILSAGLTKRYLPDCFFAHGCGYFCKFDFEVFDICKKVLVTKSSPSNFLIIVV